MKLFIYEFKYTTLINITKQKSLTKFGRKMHIFLYMKTKKKYFTTLRKHIFLYYISDYIYFRKTDKIILSKCLLELLITIIKLHTIEFANKFQCTRGFIMKASKRNINKKGWNKIKNERKFLFWYALDNEQLQREFSAPKWRRDVLKLLKQLQMSEQYAKTKTIKMV